MEMFLFKFPTTEFEVVETCLRDETFLDSSKVFLLTCA
jgi:hypothetical protein